jgi:endonuclease/exonuclease/phosphatase family metal-dependent hydrolase
LLAALSLAAAPACGKRDRTPEPPSVSAESLQAAAIADAAEPAEDGRAPSRKPWADYPPLPDEQPTTSGLRFIAYNVENWLTMDRTETGADGKRVTLPGAPKPAAAKRTVATLLARRHPDVVGIAEIGTRADLADFQATLKAAGLDLPHAHHAGGSDSTRFLALVSRYPITATGDPGPLAYQHRGTTFRMGRGILDATVAARGKSYRFLGVHLKSQREVEEGDQAAMRLAEAHLLRKHVDAILKTGPAARLIVYGDFNDNWGTPPIRTIVGAFGTPTYLTAIRASDRMGAYWTHFWKIRDSYSRLDYIAVSQAMKRDTDFAACRVIDDPEWNDASDHRPVMAVFR